MQAVELDMVGAMMRRTYDLEELNKELSGALRFILAFYDPDANKYLDTEAWKHAEAEGRRALEKYKNFPGNGQTS